MTTYPFQFIFYSFVVLMSTSNPENMSSNGQVVMEISMIPVLILFFFVSNKKKTAGEEPEPAL